MSQIVMPQAGQSMEEGTIVRWHKAEGDAVAKGEVLFEIETDKSVIEVEAAESGVLRQILVPAGKTVAIKTPVAVLDKPGEAPSAPAPAKAEEAPAAPANVRTILMPKAGQSMEEGTLVKWRVKPGEMIRKGDVIFEVETDKSVVEVESTEEGRLARIVVNEGQVSPVLVPVAYIAESDADVDAFLASAAAPAAAAAAPAVSVEGVKPILMPKAGQSMEEGTLVKWRVKVGDVIKKGDVIFDVETDKSVVEVEATEEGRLARIIVNEGQISPVLQPVAFIAESEAAVDAYLKSAPVSAPAPAPAMVAAASAASVNPQSDLPHSAFPVPHSNGGRVKASPAARKMAQSRGIDLALVGQGSGPGGRILSSDVAAAKPGAAQPVAATAKPAARAEAEVKPYSPILPKSSTSIRTKMTPMRKAIARNLLASKQNIPHWYIQRIIDADPMMAFHRAHKAKYPCSVNDVLVLAISRTIMEHPQFRSQVDGDDVVELPSVNIGIAVGLDAGLVVPVALNVERMNLQQLGAESKRLAEVARATGKVENMGKGCFTISNLGMFGVDQFTAIINPPEAAILAVSAIREDVIVQNGMMRPGRTMSLTLSADHRLIDGVLAAKFMTRLKEMLENPELFLQ